jgi:hypothetical protein
MDMNRLECIDDFSWRVKPPAGTQAEAILFGDRDLVAAMDDKVLEQIGNVALLPGLAGPAMAMPDAHWGYGFPIGGVAAFDPDRGGIISAGGVGFDISCGIRCLRTTLTADDIVPKAERLADSLFRDIPAGVGVEGSLQLGIDDLDDIMTEGAEWAVRNSFGIGVSIHCGSRGLGHQIGRARRFGSHGFFDAGRARAHEAQDVGRGFRILLCRVEPGPIKLDESANVSGNVPTGRIHRIDPAPWQRPLGQQTPQLPAAQILPDLEQGQHGEASAACDQRA